MNMLAITFAGIEELLFQVVLVSGQMAGWVSSDASKLPVNGCCGLCKSLSTAKGTLHLVAKQVAGVLPHR